MVRRKKKDFVTLLNEFLGPPESVVDPENPQTDGYDGLVTGNFVVSAACNKG